MRPINHIIWWQNAYQTRWIRTSARERTKRKASRTTTAATTRERSETKRNEITFFETNFPRNLSTADAALQSFDQIRSFIYFYMHVFIVIVFGLKCSTAQHNALYLYFIFAFCLSFSVCCCFWCGRTRQWRENTMQANHISVCRNRWRREIDALPLPGHMRNLIFYILQLFTWQNRQIVKNKTPRLRLCGMGTAGCLAQLTSFVFVCRLPFAVCPNRVHRSIVRWHFASSDCIEQRNQL